MRGLPLAACLLWALARGPAAAQDAAPFEIPQALTVTVTGRPASTAFVTRAIERRARQTIAAALPAGTTFSLGEVTPSLPPIGPGFRTDVIVPFAVYNAADPDAPIESSIRVTVKNEDPGEFASRWLYFDDDPERVSREGVTLRANVDLNFPCRVYYYHQNKGEQRRFAFVLTAAEPARVQIIDSVAGPSQDVMSVGHAGSLNFLLAKIANQGTIVDLEPGVPFTLHDTAARDGDVVNGIADIRLLSGSRITVTVVSLAPGASAGPALESPRLPGDGHARYGTFSLEAYGSQHAIYRVGSADTAISYGAREPTAPNIVPGDAGRNIGDYGIIGRIRLDAVNPSAAPATVYLYEQPHGGPVRSSFILDGATVELGCARLPQRYQIAAYELAPGASKTIDVLTMTDGGSAYPLDVGLSTAPPNAATPPIGAPDGCFPKP